MPGWSAAPQPVGPWKTITLLPHGAMQLVSRKIRARLDGADGVVSVAVRLRPAPGSDISAATVSVGGTERPAVLRRSGNDVVINATIRIADAKIWWPHTHGAQSLYDVAIAVVSDAVTERVELGRTAFRTLSLDSEAGAFGLRVNGARIFWRGACWSPADPLRLHCSAREYRRTLELARDAGINMLRVGGTMAYEHDDFYDTCTELGIAVWQDFMFANMDYPADDTTFQASVDAEVTQLLQRIGGHASLALLCGNSEVEQQAAMLGLPASEWRSSLFSERIPRLSEEYAPDVPYWPSSPSGGVLPFHVNAGDGHYFGYGPYLRPLSDVRASEVRFASETLALSNVPEPEFIDRLPCGASGAGHHPDWKRGVPRDNGSGWDFEDVRDHYVRELFGVDPVAVRHSDPERYLALGRAAGGEVMTRTIAEWRRSGSGCSGALVWLYRDLRPGAGWGILDYDGAPKAAYYYLSRAFRPVTVVMSDEGLNGIAVHAVNDGADDLLATVRLELFRGAVRIADASTTLTVAARSVAAMAADAVLGSFTDISYAYRFGSPGHDVVVATLLDKRTGRVLADAFHFPLGIGSVRSEAHLDVHAERLDARTCALTLCAQDLALAVRVAADGWRPDDNYFHIAPGSTRTVMLRSGGQPGSVAGWVTALNGVAPHRFQTA
jgi:beta-mannosidase